MHPIRAATKKEISSLRTRRCALRLTQVELAWRAKISQGTLSRLERGERALLPEVASRLRLALYQAERDAARVDPMDIGMPLGDLLAIHCEANASK